MNINQQFLSTLCIILGASLLIYGMDEQENAVYFQVGGFIILMLGLYRSTRVWVKENKTQDEQEEDS